MTKQIQVQHPFKPRLFPNKPTLDLEEFTALRDLLYLLFKGSSRSCARALGISVNKWNRWEHTPPQWIYWNFVIRHVITDHLAYMDKGGITASRRHKILTLLSKIPRHEEITEQVILTSETYRGATLHLRNLLLKKGMYWDEIRLPANCGGYQQKALRLAAKKLGIVQTSEGFGKNKRSFWRLPVD